MRFTVRWWILLCLHHNTAWVYPHPYSTILLCLINYLFYLYFSHVVRLSPLGTAAIVWPIVPAPDVRWWWWWLWSSWWNANWQGKLKYCEKTYPSATLSTTNPTWPDPDSNLDHCSGKLATIHLSYGTAIYLIFTAVMSLCVLKIDANSS
jgi:hypothetical protein